MAASKQQPNSNDPKKKLTSVEATRFVRRFSVSILEKSGRGSGRVVAIGIGIAIVLWLVTVRVYTPLRQEAGLPPGVTTSDPKLKENDIQFLVNQYSERSSHTTQTYAQFRGLFIP